MTDQELTEVFNLWLDEQRKLGYYEVDRIRRDGIQDSGRGVACSPYQGVVLKGQNEEEGRILGADFLPVVYDGSKKFVLVPNIIGGSVKGDKKTGGAERRLGTEPASSRSDGYLQKADNDNGVNPSGKHEKRHRTIAEILRRIRSFCHRQERQTDLSGFHYDRCTKAGSGISQGAYRSREGIGKGF